MPVLRAFPTLATREWTAWTTTVRLVVTRAERLDEACRFLTRQMEKVDAAASRFRTDSEVSALFAAGGRPTRVSPLLAALIGVALDAAATTDGAVDPTLGGDLVALGYASDLTTVGGPAERRTHRVGVLDVSVRSDWSDVELVDGVVTVPRGVLLDLGCTAKAWTADACASTLAERLGCGVLVSIGGDLRAAGDAPEGGWTVLVQDGPDEPSSLITFDGLAAVATSSTLHRTWRQGVRTWHHILDPRLRRPVPAWWRTVSVAAPTCVEANVLSTAAMVAGAEAVAHLHRSGRPARLVTGGGTVVRTPGWPT